MKICWDNLEHIKLTIHGNFTKNCGSIFVYRDGCENCNEPYLMSKYLPTKFCSRSCSASGKNNSMYGKFGKAHPMRGKKHSEESKARMSKAHMGKKLSKETKAKLSAISKNRKHSAEVKASISKANLGKKRTTEQRMKMSKAACKGEKHRRWKGGIRKLKIPLYDTYSHQIDFAEKTRLYIDENNLKLLEVKCVYCNKWYVPKLNAVYHRISSLNGRHAGESSFYCSDGCKKACPVYNQSKYPKGFKKATSREVNPYTRKLGFERDDWTCQKCEFKENLHCHHIKNYNQNKILANDVDNCITLCKTCHKEIHSTKGCKYNDFKCKEE